MASFMIRNFREGQLKCLGRTQCCLRTFLDKEAGGANSGPINLEPQPLHRTSEAPTEAGLPSITHCVYGLAAIGLRLQCWAQRRSLTHVGLSNTVITQGTRTFLHLRASNSRWMSSGPGDTLGTGASCSYRTQAGVSQLPHLGQWVGYPLDPTTRSTFGFLRAQPCQGQGVWRRHR